MEITRFEIISFDRMQAQFELCCILNLGFGCRFQFGALKGLALPLPAMTGNAIDVQLYWQPTGKGDTVAASYQHSDAVRAAVMRQFQQHWRQSEIRPDVLQFVPACVPGAIRQACEIAHIQDAAPRLIREYSEAISQRPESTADCRQRQLIVERTHALIEEKVRVVPQPTLPSSQWTWRAA